MASAHVDTFAERHLPPREQWPEFLFERPELRYPERLNCAGELLDRMVAGSGGIPGGPSIGRPRAPPARITLASRRPRSGVFC